MSTMALSAKAALALDRVKSGLSMLYMADYFTEDEWMKIDVCIHKGEYVFTNGPPKHILDMDMSDDGQSSEAVMSLHSQQVGHSQSAERQEKGEEIAPVDSAEDTTDAVDSGPGSTLNLSSPPSSTEEPPEVLTSDIITSGVDEDTIQEEGNSFDLSPELSQPPSATKPVEAPSTVHTLEDATPETGEYLSSNTPEDNHRINQWASETESASRDCSQPFLADPVERLVDEFTRKIGRPPRNINDVYQPNNANFRPLAARPASRTTSTKSRQSTKVAKSLAAVVEHMQPRKGKSMTNFKPGVVLIAEVGVPNPPVVGMVVKTGDSIKVVKHVSGIFHFGKNLTSGKSGQFSEKIFSRPTAPHQQIAAPTVRKSPASELETPSVVDLDQFERHNAAQWDEVPARAQPAPAVKSNFGGLAKSKYAVLEDELPASSSCSEQDLEHGRSREVAGNEDAKFDPQQQEQQQSGPEMLPQTGPRRPHQPKSGWKEPLKPVERHRETCPMWGIPNSTCRYKAEECRDLHVFVPLAPGQEPSNIRNGKPTWGAYVDYEPAENTSPFMIGVPSSAANNEYDSQVSEFEDRCLRSPPMSPSAPSNSSSKSRFTCLYWAEGGCKKSDEICKYQHAWTPAGVAHRPRKAQERNRWDHPAHPARRPENQTFRPAQGGYEWLEEERQRLKGEYPGFNGETVKRPSKGQLVKEDQGNKPAVWDRSGPVEPEPVEGSTVKTRPAARASDADGWITTSQRDLKQEIGW